MSAVLTLACGILLALVGWRWSAGALDRASRLALVSVLGITAATFNVIVPVPSIEATTTVVLCSAIVLGARTATLVGLVAVIASSIAGGVGAWTIWQLVAAGLVALLGALVARVGGRGGDWYHGRRLVLLAASAAVATLCWDVVVTVGGIASYATQPGLTPLEQLVSVLLLGLAFTIVHVAFTTAFTVVGGPPLLHALERARPRLNGGVVAPASRSRLAQHGS